MRTLRAKAFLLLCFLSPAFAEPGALQLEFPGAVQPTPQYENVSRLRMREVYPGIDVVFYSNHGTAEYDFLVAPLADASRIRIRFADANNVELTNAGDVLVETGTATFNHQRPLAYQNVGGKRKSIACRYRLSNGEVSLEIGDYDHESVLVIDPVVKSLWNIPTGGGDDVTRVTGVTSDSSGYVYVTGSTSFPGFPVTPGPLSTRHANDIFVMKLAPTTYQMVWSVLVGGSSGQTGAGIQVDGQSNVYVSGYTNSPDFPVTSRPTNGHVPSNSDPDLLVFKLNATGTALVYSTTIGGTGNDTASSLALTTDNRAVVVGSTNSLDFPVTAGAFQESLGAASGNRNAVVVRLSNAGAIEYGSYLGGSSDSFATDVAVDSTGDIYIAGIAGAFFPTLASSFAPLAPYGGFVTRLDHGTGLLVYSTYIPGVSLNDFEAYPSIVIRVDDSQNAYVAGPAQFTFPTTPGAFQADVNSGDRNAFVLELNPTGTELIFSTLIGGSQTDLATAIALTGDSVTIAGITDSFDFPASDYSMPTCNLNSIPYDSPYFSTFVASFDHSGKRLYASEYSGCQDERATAMTYSSGMLVIAGRYEDFDTPFLVSIDPSASNPVQVSVVADSASFQVGASCPLELISIFGSGLGPRKGVIASPSGGYFPTQLAGTSVTFGGILAPLLYVSESQINAVVPANVSMSEAALAVSTAAGTSAQNLTWIEKSTPAIFSVDQSGSGQGAILNEDGTLNSASNPAPRGSIISMFGTGGGLTNPPFGDGQVVPAAAPLALTPFVGFDGLTEQYPGLVTYAGAAPSLVNGVMQINVQLPLDVVTGPAVPIVISSYPYLTTGITVAIK